MSSPSSRPGPGSELRIAGRLRDAREAARTTSPSLAGDLERLFEAHQGRVRALCLKMVRDPERADELVQETLLVAFSKLGEFDGQARFGTWIYGIGRNLCLNAIRKRGELLSEDGVVECQDGSTDALAALEADERAELVRLAAAAVLEPGEQEAVHLRYVMGMPLDRITELLELEGTGARGLLQRCRRKLGRELRSQLEALGHGSSFLRPPSG